MMCIVLCQGVLISEVELGPEDVSLLERCPHFSVMFRLHWS